MVGLEADLSVQGRLDLALVSTSAGEYSTAKLNLDKELRVEDAGRRIERRSGNGRVNMVGGSDCVAAR